MARYRRRDQTEARLADELAVGDRSYTVDLIAKRATGVEGYRMTLSFVALEGGDSAIVQLEPAETQDEVERRAERLAEEPDRLRELLLHGSGEDPDVPRGEG